MYKKINNLLLLIILAVVIMLTGYVGLAVAGAVAGGPGPSANGHGNVNDCKNVRTFSFHAREFRDGSVEGSFQLNSHETGTRLHGEINCLSIVEVDNEAFMSGVVLQSDGPVPCTGGDCTGWVALFSVRDNDEGLNGTPDQITPVALASPSSPLTCNDMLTSFLLFDIEKGNIQVQP